MKKLSLFSILALAVPMGLLAYRNPLVSQENAASPVLVDALTKRAIQHAKLVPPDCHVYCTNGSCYWICE